MANNLVSNPIVLDTAGATVLTFGGTIYLDEIYWENPTSSGDTFNVTLGDGTQVIQHGRCESANQSQVFQMYARPVSAIRLTAISSGTLYIKYHV